MLKDADGAPVANQNFHDVEADMRRAADLLQPAVGGPPERLFLAITDGAVARPTLFGLARLDLHEDQDLSFQYHEVEFIRPATPVAGQDLGARGPIMGGGPFLAPPAKGLVRGELAARLPPEPAEHFMPKHASSGWIPAFLANPVWTGS